MQAIILAGGKGERLRPLTSEKPKPMVSVLDKPLMEYLIELLKKHGIFEIGITLKFLPNQIRSYFGNGEKWGVNIKYFEETNALGTAGGVKAAQNFLRDTFIVLSGDALTNVNIEKILTFHKSNKNDVTIVSTRVDDPTNFGGITVDTSCKVLSFNEKPQWESIITDLVNTGIYVLEPKILNEIPQNSFYDFANDLFPKILDKYNVFTYITTDYWCDLGTHQSFIKANKDILSKNVVECGGNYIGKNVKIDKSAIIKEPVYIGNDTIVGANCVIGPFVSVGKNSILENSTVKNSVLFEKTVIFKTEIKDSIIGENTHISDAVLGGGNVLGSNVCVKENAHILAQEVIENNLTVDVDDRGFAKKDLWQNGKIVGIWNHDITPAVFSSLASCVGENFIAIGYNSLSLPYSCASLCASFCSLAGKTAYVAKSNLTSFKYFCFKNECYGIFIQAEQEILKIIIINSHGVEITSEEEKKISFNSSNFALERGRIIRLSTLDADFEYLLDTTFPYSVKNVQIFSDYKLRLHNVICAEHASVLADVQIFEKDGQISEIKYKNEHLSAESFLLLKVALCAFYGADSVFLPEYASQEVIEFAKNNNLTPKKLYSHRGNTFKESKGILSFEVLVEVEPFFFAQALSFYLLTNKIKVDKNRVLAKKQYYLPKSKTCKIVSVINKNKNSKITVVPFSSGNGFTMYANTFLEEYSPDIFDNVISKAFFDNK